METPYGGALCLLAKSPGYVAAVCAVCAVAAAAADAADVVDIRVELLKEVVCEDVGLDSVVVSIAVWGHETSPVIDDQKIIDRSPSEELKCS
jgi:hypothetical protein